MIVAVVAWLAAANDACLAHVRALDYASASASCRRAADDVDASPADRATALVALGTSLASLNEDDVAVDAFVQLLVIDDTARLGDGAGHEAQAAFDRARGRLLRDGAVRAHLEQQSDGRGSVRIDVVIAADPLGRVIGARVVDDRERTRMPPSDDDRFTLDVPQSSEPVPYRVELLGPADSVVLVDEPLIGTIGPLGGAPPPSVAADAPRRRPDDTTPFIAGSAAYDVSSWSYAFDGGGVGDEQLTSSSFAGVSVRADARPLLASFGYRFLGVDADLALASLPFTVGGTEFPVAPSSFSALQMRAGVSLAVRYTFDDAGVVVGARGGYRYFGQTVDVQTVDVGGDLQPLTIIPGFTFNGMALGVDALVPFRDVLLGNDVELDGRAEAIPVAVYTEEPDAPGDRSAGLGWNAGLGARVVFADVVFVEVRAQSEGASFRFTGQGSRQAVVGAGLARLAGGSVVNATETLSLGVGARY